MSTRQEWMKLGWKFKSNSSCRACHKPIEWWITPGGKFSPLIAKFTDGLEDLTSHFADCENRLEFRKANAKHKERVEGPTPKQEKLF